MSKFVHGVLQVLGVAVQVANLSLSVVPPKYQALVAGAVGVAQTILALYNHGGSNGQVSK